MRTVFLAAEAATEAPTWKNVLHVAVEWATNTGLKIIIGLVALFFVFRIINFIGKKVLKKFRDSSVDKTVYETLIYAGKIVLKIAAVIGFVSYVGIDTSGFTALIASLGVTVGLAVNGALSNLAGGILILVTRPFKIDDYIEVDGVGGTVEDIHMITTRIVTPDNRVVYIPNSTVSSGKIVNYSQKETRRQDHEFLIAQDGDYESAIALAKEILEKNEKVLKDPAPAVRISGHGPDGVKIVLRFHTKASDYWGVYYDVLEAVKAAFRENGIPLPHEQVDVHLKKE